MNRITPAMIDAAIVRQDFFTAAEGVKGHTPAGLRAAVPPERLKQITFCVLTLTNGHVAVGVNHGPVDASQFDEEWARKEAKKNAVDQLWPLFGFALREQRALPGAEALKAHLPEGS